MSRIIDARPLKRTKRTTIDDHTERFCRQPIRPFEERASDFVISIDNEPATVGKRKPCAVAHSSPLKRALLALHKSRSPDPNVIVDRPPRELCLNEDRPPRELCLNGEEDVASAVSIEREHDDANLAIDELLQTDDVRSWVGDLVGDELLEGEHVRSWILDNIAGVVEKKTVSRLARVQIDAKRHGRDNSMRWEYDESDTMLGAWCDDEWFSAAEIRSFV